MKQHVDELLKRCQDAEDRVDLVESISQKKIASFQSEGATMRQAIERLEAQLEEDRAGHRLMQERMETERSDLQLQVEGLQHQIREADATALRAKAAELESVRETLTAKFSLEIQEMEDYNKTISEQAEKVRRCGCL